MILYNSIVFLNYSFTEFGCLEPKEAQPVYYEYGFPFWLPDLYVVDESYNIFNLEEFDRQRIAD